MNIFLYIVLPVMLALVATNYRPVWNPLKKVINTIHWFGHALFALPAGPAKLATPRENQAAAGHDLTTSNKIVRTIALLMGHPTPVILGGSIMALSFLLPLGPVSALVLLLSAVVTFGGFNQLIDVTVFSNKGTVTDAVLLMRLTRKESNRWVNVMWAIALIVPVLVTVAVVITSL